jgi:plastocyanin
MHLTHALCALAALVFADSAWAADVTIIVRTAAGKPVADAVVTLDGRAKTSSFKPQARYLVEQRDLAFLPHVSVVPTGASVSFPNLDRTQHHVYSFSAAGPFELRLFPRGETRSVRFERPGSIAVGCNIHDQMSAFIRVTDAPFAGVTDHEGRVVLADVEAGAFSLGVWHPQQAKSLDGLAVSRAVQIKADGAQTETIEVALRRRLGAHGHY